MRSKLLLDPMSSFFAFQPPVSETATRFSATGIVILSTLRLGLRQR